MPLYEYRCLNCEQTFSLLQRVGASEKDTICPQCGSSAVKKLISAFAYAGSDSSVGFSGGFSGST